MQLLTQSNSESVHAKPRSNTVNRRIVLNSRPVGAPSSANFRLEELAVPAPSGGQVLMRTLYLSLDPYMRGRMNDAPTYAAPGAVGEVMFGRTVSRVEASRHPGYRRGDLVRFSPLSADHKGQRQDVLDQVTGDAEKYSLVTSRHRIASPEIGQWGGTCGLLARQPINLYQSDRCPTVRES
jgi:NADPH-dependent curcumin reductase CurA